MINTNKLKGRMREMGVTQKDLAAIIGNDQATVNRKINDVTGYFLKARDLEKIIEVLKIDDIREYFFT
jgi:transcriptional regulator with XRE-family HTH domain